ncbi:MAG: hypothetical protein LBE36_08245 [Flavobacteriaceae bacterium]|jgi:hypothetical protein|nr:hypothetical protein [Flavobacteriaceae bacterium]
MENINIQPIDADFNKRLEFGIQYYEISNYKKYSPQELSAFIQDYVSRNEKEIKNSQMLLFYKKSLIANYNRNMRESARDNEFGGIEGYTKNLVAKVWYNYIDDKMEQHIIIYNNGRITLKRSYPKVSNTQF